MEERTMGFQFTNDLTAHYYTYGYAVFRRILPPSLVDDLRRVSDRAREIARATHGRQVQRLQPIWEHEGVELGPFWQFAELPELCAALAKLLSPRHIQGIPYSILFEPADRPYTIGWHRDWYSMVGEEAIGEVLYDL